MSRSANWIKQTTTTTGTGTIDLDGSAATGFVEFVDQVEDGGYVRYFIEDGDDREEGNGVFTAGTPDTLTRADVIAKLVSGTLTKFPAGPTGGLSLSTGATVTINASSDNTAGNGIPYTRVAAMRDLPDNYSDFSTSVTNATADKQIFLPCLILFRRRINEFWIDVKTLDAGSTDTRVGLWEQASNGEPGLLLFGSSHIDVSTTGVKTAVPSSEIVLEPGVYWLGFRSDSTTVACSGCDAASSASHILGGPGGVGEFDNQRRLFQSLTSQTGTPVSDLSPNGSVSLSAGVGFNS